MFKAARLDRETFLNLKEDNAANLQSVSVVALAGSCYGLGFSLFFEANLSGVIFATVIACAAGILLAFTWLSLSFLVGTKILGGETSYWGLARPFFFSWSPGILFLLTSIPASLFSTTVRGVATGWIIIASVVAVKNAMGLDNQRSLLTFILAFFVLATIYGIIISL